MNMHELNSSIIRPGDNDIKFEDPPYFVELSPNTKYAPRLVHKKLYTVTRVRVNLMGMKKLVEFYVHEINENLPEGYKIWVDRRCFITYLSPRPQ